MSNTTPFREAPPTPGVQFLEALNSRLLELTDDEFEAVEKAFELVSTTSKAAPRQLRIAAMFLKLNPQGKLFAVAELLQSRGITVG